MSPKPTHHPDTDNPEQDSSRLDDVPACQRCRKKKARCSRSQPCDQCTRVNVPCVYDNRRLKPGLRAGAVDQLYRRIETLESMFLGQGVLWQQMWQSLYPETSWLRSAPPPSNLSELEQRREQLRTHLLQHAPNSRRSVDQDALQPSPSKRPRLREPSLSALSSEVDSDPSSLLPPDIMNELVDFYYVNIHHWIPILHVAKFRERMESEEERPRIACILHAIVAICVRFSSNEWLRDEHTKLRIAEKSRQKVILDSIESFSVENLQALIIVAFETIGRGRGPSSWSIIGNMVGTVEQLQLNTEEDEIYRPANSGETLIRRMLFLTPSKSWGEAEERRRVFWTVFLMDRFCSVSTGWKMSLTSADIKRRLPCEGALWEKEQEVRTPYFGIPKSKETTPSSSVQLGSQGLAIQEDQDSMGGLAYNIEATESLALVTNFFLHHAFVVDDVEKVQLWMMKFKELDLRLMQWKLYLPPRWREASVLNSDGVMDPNLTLAHITHNTAVILLHQGIAYPPAHWRSCVVKLPSASSAETCLEAASEIARIGQQFLAYSPIFTNPQFSFCLFIAGRMLLAHSRYNQVAIPSALDTLIASLLEISQRWAGGREATDTRDDNLASSFAKRLMEAQNSSADDFHRSLDIRQTAYSDESEEQPRSTPAPSLMSLCEVGSFSSRPANPAVSAAGDMSNMASVQEPFSYDPLSLAFPPLPPAFQRGFPLSMYPQAFENSGPSSVSPSAMQSFNPPALDIWQNSRASLGNAVVNPRDDLSHGSGQTSSPGQRISRFGGVHTGSQIPDPSFSGVRRSRQEP